MTGAASCPGSLSSSSGADQGSVDRTYAQQHRSPGEETRPPARGCGQAAEPPPPGFLAVTAPKHGTSPELKEAQWRVAKETISARVPTPPLPARCPPTRSELGSGSHPLQSTPMDKSKVSKSGSSVCCCWKTDDVHLSLLQLNDLPGVLQRTFEVLQARQCEKLRWSTTRVGQAQ